MEHDRNSLKFLPTAARPLKHALAAGVLFVLAGQPASAQPAPAHLHDERSGSANLARRRKR